MSLALLRPRPLWRVILLGCVCFATVFWANTAFAQAIFEGGSRNSDEWYYCHSTYFNDVYNDPVIWNAWECDHLLWQSEPGNPSEYDSVEFGAELVLSAGEFAAGAKGYILPPQGIYQWDYACDALTQHSRAPDCTAGQCTSGGFTSGKVVGSVGSTSSQITSATTNFELLLPGVPDPGQTDYGILNTVGLFRSTSGTTDYLWSRSEQLAAALNSTTAPLYSPYFELQTFVSRLQGRSVGGGYACQVTDWSMLAGEDFWMPDIGDLVPLPTPSPGEGWVPGDPWVPITDTEKMPQFEIGEPGEEICTVIIPGYTWEWSSVEYSWEPIEFCTREQEWTISLFGIDIGTYLVTVFVLSSIGVLVSIMKRA